MNNIDEIKTVILLTGGKRIPHLEAEIFADEELTTLYLHGLCKESLWYRAGDNNDWLAYIYVRDILKIRWPVAEEIIKTNGHWWSRYIDVTTPNE